jgi:general secretion pathway protein C
MSTYGKQLFGARAATFVVAALAAASAVYWGLRVIGPGEMPADKQAVAVVAAQAVDPQAVARALGGGVTAAEVPPAAAPSVSSRFVLMGVVADSASGGTALIAVDGKPARPFRVGAGVDGRLVLQSVTGRKANLAAATDSPVEVTLELPALAK